MDLWIWVYEIFILVYDIFCFNFTSLITSSLSLLKRAYVYLLIPLYFCSVYFLFIYFYWYWVFCHVVMYTSHLLVLEMLHTLTLQCTQVVERLTSRVSNLTTAKTCNIALWFICCWNSRVSKFTGCGMDGRWSGKYVSLHHYRL